tara:strand:+ start:610 stop:861 length:252 start_codon:yes stop_codon:yes gene_type:complete
MKKILPIFIIVLSGCSDTNNFIDNKTNDTISVTEDYERNWQGKKASRIEIIARKRKNGTATPDDVKEFERLYLDALNKKKNSD